MNQKEIIAAIQFEKPVLETRFGVKEIGLFGSYARNEANENSYVDLFVSTRIKTLGNYFALLDYLQSKLHQKIDLVTKHNGLSERFLKLIHKDIIYV
jgi:uncharacterized protein